MPAPVQPPPLLPPAPAPPDADRPSRLTLDVEGSTAAADAELASNLEGIDRFAAGIPEIFREPIRAMLRQGAMAAWVFDVARSVRVTVRGYAPPPGVPLPKPAPPRPPARYVPPPKAPKAKPKTTSTSGDFAFLHDAKLSIEEKLFRFMMAVQKRTDRELQDAMERYEKEFAKSKSTSGSGSSAQAAKKDDGGGLFGFLGDVVDALGAVCPPLAIARSTLGDLGLDKIVTQLSGPLLASLCTAWGLPVLAPIALQLAPQVVQSVLSETSSSTASSSASGSSGSGSSEKTDNDERYELMKLQRLVEKQQQMFSLISNMLKVMHETGMTAIHNIR